MRLSKIYSNDKRFSPISFDLHSINAIIAVGNEPHSIGKTTLFKLINYCLLQDSKPQFLKQTTFNDFTFFLELLLNSGEYLTIRRSVSGRANTAFKKHTRQDDFTDLKDEGFDFIGGDETALDKVNEILDLSINNKAIKNFRRYLGYFLREKDDFSHAFMLNKYKKGKDVEWKTLVASLIDINDIAVRKKFNTEKEIEVLENEIKYQENNENCSISEIEVAKETQRSLEIELVEKERIYAQFDFYLKEHSINKELVSEVENSIAALNKERYSLDKKHQLITESLIEEQEIDLKKVKKLFHQVGMHISDMLVKSFEEVLEFNKQITHDRDQYLNAEQSKISKRLNEIDDLLQKYNQKRRELLSVLTETDTFDKFKKLEKEIVDIKNRIYMTEQYLKKLRQYKCRLKRIKILERRKEKTISLINQSISHPSHTHTHIKELFKRVSNMVLGVDAILTVGLNRQGNLEFNTKVIDTKKILENTKEEGEAFSRMFCFIFDISVALTYKESQFFHFVAHDGLFDNLGHKYKDGLINVLNMLKNEGIQYIFTSIEDELQNVNQEFVQLCKSEYLSRELADNNSQRLFKMDTF